MDYGSCLLNFFSWTSMYVSSFFPIPFVHSKICPRQATIMGEKWLRGDNSINIGWIMVHVFWTSSHEHLWCTKLNFNPFILSKIWPGQATNMNKWLRGDNSINIQGTIMILMHCSFTHCHPSMYQVWFQTHFYFPRYGQDKHL